MEKDLGLSARYSALDEVIEVDMTKLDSVVANLSP